MNPYLAEFERLRGNQQSDGSYHFQIHFYSNREELVRRYSWAIPDEAAIATLVAHSPIVEVGAGTGYWASLVAAAGGTIHAYDKNPPTIRENEYKHSVLYHPVLPVELMRLKKETLFLCWPPYADSMAVNVLRKYEGDTLIYVGEDEYGCTANDAFFKELVANWQLLKQIDIPQWKGINDTLNVYQRKS